MEEKLKKEIMKYLNQMNELYKKCDAKYEEALIEYVVCMKRLLNGLVQMCHTQLNGYELQILGNPMKIFAKEFVEQVEVALECTDTKEKKKLIKDIENSLYEMSNVYKNVVDGTANSDRQMFMSKAVDSNMYELSPKVCAFYSSILEKTVKVFGGNDGEYAFLLHPTMRSNIEARQMFRKREAPGKVVILSIPENIIEEIDVLPVHILHEAFHVLTKKERNRKLRAECYLKYMLYEIRERLFQNVDFGEEGDEVEEKLFSDWMRDASRIKKDILGKDEDSRSLYGEKLAKWILDELREILQNLNDKVEETIEGCYCITEQNYRAYYEGTEKAMKISATIRSNLIKLIWRSNLKKISDIFLRINETVINPPAELGRLTNAGGDKQSTKKENSAV